MLILNQRSSQNEGRRSKIPRRCSGDLSHHFHHHHHHHHCHVFSHHHCHLTYYNYHDDLRCAGRLSTTIKTIMTTTTTMTTTTIRLSLLLNSHLLCISCKYVSQYEDDPVEAPEAVVAEKKKKPFSSVVPQQQQVNSHFWSCIDSLIFGDEILTNQKTGPDTQTNFCFGSIGNV